MPPRKKKVIVEEPIVAKVEAIPSLDDLIAENCRRSLYQFVKEFWGDIIPEKMVDNWHIKYLCDELQEIGFKLSRRERKDEDLIINICPSTSKSTILSIMLPAWLWTIDPKLRIICVSYAGSLSLDQSSKSRQIINGEKYKRYFGVEIREDANVKSNFQTTAGGQRISTSTLAAITGQHAHVIIVDDSMNVTQANSELERNAINEWLSTTLSTRKVDPEVSVMIFCQQRLHPQDSTGYLLAKGKEYKRISLPAELNKNVFPEELKAKYVLGLLDPVRLSPEVLMEKKKDLGSRAYNAQYLQNPESTEDSIIKESWLKVITKEEFAVIKGTTSPVIDFYLDTSFTDNKKNDPSALLACTKIGEILYILNVSQKWLEFVPLLSHIKAFTALNGYTSRSKIIVEPKASGKSVVQYLRTQTDLNVVEGADPRTSKTDRLNAISPKVEAMRVVLVEGDYVTKFLGEICIQTPLHDDQRDVFVAAVEDKLVRSRSHGVYHISII